MRVAWPSAGTCTRVGLSLAVTARPQGLLTAMEGHVVAEGGAFLRGGCCMEVDSGFLGVHGCGPRRGTCPSLFKGAAWVTYVANTGGIRAAECKDIPRTILACFPSSLFLKALGSAESGQQYCDQHTVRWGPFAPHLPHGTHTFCCLSLL